jgi:hypothetical protein
MATVTDRLTAIEAKIDALAEQVADQARQAGYYPTDRLLDIRERELESGQADARLTDVTREVADRILAGLAAEAEADRRWATKALNLRRLEALSERLPEALQQARLQAAEGDLDLQAMREAVQRENALERYAAMAFEELEDAVFGNDLALCGAQGYHVEPILRDLWQEVERQIVE